jgi:hypothetical protein
VAKCFQVTCFGLLCASLAFAGELKVDLNPPERRGDILTPHWENWAWQDGASGSRTFNGVTVTFKPPSAKTLGYVFYKGLLDYGVHMGCDGIAVTERNAEGAIDMLISGLTPGKHTVATYHNEVSHVAPAKVSVFLGESRTPACSVVPTHRATNDYEIASAFVEVEAVAGKDVVLHFRPDNLGGNRNLVINGFEIDAVDPHKKAIKPSPENDDEHVPVDSALSWTPASGAIAHQFYFGTDSNAVASAMPSSAEFKGTLKEPTFRFSSPQPSTLDPHLTYFWRVDEVNGPGTQLTKGEVWRFRPRFLAFPTAEGYGRFARGGRGGKVIEVTNLNDYDISKGEAVIPGTFRAAVESEGPRTIVFRVSGLIRLKRPCAVTKPYCTIAGQTAPGDGICLANYSSGAFGTHDVIIRFMRFRIGDAARKAMDGAGLGSCDHCIMDHCSISWSSDEGTSSRNARNITFQRNIVAEALHHSYHYRANDRSKYETHAFAGSISGNVGSYHHNLLAHCTDRNWSLAGGYNQSGVYAGILDIRNNVVYNWTSRTTDGGVARMNYVNNYYKPFPKNPFVKWLLKLDPIDPSHGTEKYFMSGNILEGSDCETDNWKAFHNGPAVEKLVRVDQPLFEPYVKTQSAREAFSNVLGDVGAMFPKQDAIDRRIIEEVRSGTTHYSGTKGPTYGDRPGPNCAGIIDEPTDDKDAEGSPNFPWPEYRTYNVPIDSDHDGMPDDWEKSHGLNLNNPSDANGDRDGDGYTNLEEYLGALAGEFPNAISKSETRNSKQTRN